MVLTWCLPRRTTGSAAIAAGPVAGIVRGAGPGTMLSPRPTRKLVRPHLSFARGHREHHHSLGACPASVYGLLQSATCNCRDLHQARCILSTSSTECPLAAR